jgi:hypothetical protein
MARTCDEIASLTSHDTRETNAWRAHYLCEQAKRLEAEAGAKVKEAARLRTIASRLNPTTSS